MSHWLRVETSDQFSYGALWHLAAATVVTSHQRWLFEAILSTINLVVIQYVCSTTCQQFTQEVGQGLSVTFCKQLHHDTLVSIPHRHSLKDSQFQTIWILNTFHSDTISEVWGCYPQSNNVATQFMCMPNSHQFHWTIWNANHGLTIQDDVMEAFNWYKFWMPHEISKGISLGISAEEIYFTRHHRTGFDC